MFQSQEVIVLSVIQKGCRLVEILEHGLFLKEGREKALSALNI